jgi:hypothetical protein
VVGEYKVGEYNQMLATVYRDMMITKTPLASLDSIEIVIP